MKFVYTIVKLPRGIFLHSGIKIAEKVDCFGVPEFGVGISVFWGVWGIMHPDTPKYRSPHRAVTDESLFFVQLAQ
jgi:hypothetical protein